MWNEEKSPLSYEYSYVLLPKNCVRDVHQCYLAWIQFFFVVCCWKQESVLCNWKKYLHLLVHISGRRVFISFVSSGREVLLFLSYPSCRPQNAQLFANRSACCILVSWFSSVNQKKTIPVVAKLVFCWLSFLKVLVGKPNHLRTL